MLNMINIGLGGAEGMLCLAAIALNLLPPSSAPGLGRMGR